MAHSQAHRKAISNGLKTYHARKRRSKTFIGRIVNKLTEKHKVKRQAKRAAKVNIKRAQLSKIKQNIVDLRGKIQHIHKELIKIPSGKQFAHQRLNLQMQSQALRDDLTRLKEYRQRILGSK